MEKLLRTYYVREYMAGVAALEAQTPSATMPMQGARLYSIRTPAQPGPVSTSTSSENATASTPAAAEWERRAKAAEDKPSALAQERYAWKTPVEAMRDMSTLPRTGGAAYLDLLIRAKNEMDQHDKKALKIQVELAQERARLQAELQEKLESQLAALTLERDALKAEVGSIAAELQKVADGMRATK